MRSPSRWLVPALLALLSASRAAADEARSLDHDSALRLAAERNAALLVASLERGRTAAAADAARRGYLPEVTIEAAAKESGSADQKRSAVETLATLSYASPYGQAVTVSAALTTGLAPARDTGRSLTIELSQALLRGGFHPGGAADLKQADLDVRIAREQYKDRLNQLLQRVDRAYWDLAFARDDVEIKRRSRDRARAQFEETRENIRRGLLAPGEIYVVEENVVNFDDVLIRAEESLLLAQSALRRLMNLPPSAPIAASSRIEVGAADDPAEAPSLGVAAAKNPALLAARLAAERATIGIAADTRKALPQLDVFGSFGLASGATDDLLLGVSGSRQIRGGLRLSLPAYWGPDAARVRRARTELLQRRGEVREAESAAETAVRDASIRLRVRRQRLELASRLVELAQKKLDNERDKYKSGLATLADVVRFQRDLDNATSAALRARVDLLTARTELMLARGDLHEAARVVVQ